MPERLDLEAFCELEYPRLVGTLRLYCGNEEVAREFAQEALALACANWRKVSRMEAPGGWVNTVALNLARGSFRRRAAERRALARHGQPTHGSTTDVDAAIAVRQAVAQLPHREKTALILRYYVGMSVHDAAQALGCPEGTIKRLTHNAVTRLRSSKLIEGWAEVTDD